jgi:hypothetical protein
MPALKAILKSLDGLSDAVKELYKKDGDDYRLEVEGMVPKASLDEFRDSNVELKKKNEDLAKQLKQWDGIDITKVRENQELEKKVKEGELVKAGKLDELKSSWLDPIKTEFQTKLDQITQANTHLTTQLESMQIDGELSKLAATKGIRPTAIEDMLHRGKKVFKLKDGKVVAQAGDGTTLTTKTGDPMTMTAWVDTLAADAPHLFQPSGGGGAPPANPNGGGGNNGVKTVKRSVFDGWNAQEKHDFTIKEKGQVID